MIQIKELFQQEPCTGMNLLDLTSLSQLIQSSYNSPDPRAAQDKILEIQKSDLAFNHLLEVLETIYHYQTISQLNPNFNKIFLDQLIIYSTILLENIGKSERVLKFQESVIRIYASSIHVVFKWSGISKTRHHFQTLLSRANSTVMKLSQELQNATYSALIDFVYQKLHQLNNQICVPVYVLVEGLVHFLYEVGGHQEKFKAIILESLYQISQIQLLQAGGEELCYVISQLLAVLVQKFEQYDKQSLHGLANHKQILVFVSYNFQHQNYEKTRQVLLNMLCRLITEMQKDNQIPSSEFTQLILFVVQTVSESYKNVPTTSVEYLINHIDIIRLGISFPDLYQFYQINYKRFLGRLILVNLISDAQEVENLHSNSSDYIELQLQLVDGVQVQTLKSVSCQMIQALALKVDGFLSYIFSLALEYLTFLLTGQNFIEKTKDFFGEYQNSSFFYLNKEQQTDICLTIIALLYEQVCNNRRDLRKSLEQFLINNLTLLSKHDEPLVRVKLVLIIRCYLPNMFSKKESNFHVLVKVLFSFLNKENHKKVLAIKSLALDTLCELIENEKTSLRMETSVHNHFQKIKHYLKVGDPKTFYRFVSKVLKAYQSFIECFLDQTLEAIVKRIGDCFLPTKDVIQKHNNKQRAGVIIIEGLKLFSQVLEYDLCRQRYLPQIEPALLELSNIFFENNKYFPFLDELFDIYSFFVQVVKGQSEITYRVMSFMEKFGNQEKFVNPSTVFKVYYAIMTSGNLVMLTQPKWAIFIGQHLLLFLERELITNLMLDSTNFIKILILTNTLYQFYIQYSVELIQTFILRLLPYLQQIDPLLPGAVKLIYVIFSPYIYNRSYLDQQSIQILQQCYTYLQRCYSIPQTIYNYKLLFLINLFMVNDILPSDSDVLCQLLKFTIQQLTSYIDKQSFNSKIGSLNFKQQSRIEGDQIEDRIENDEQTSKESQEIGYPTLGPFGQGSNIELFMNNMMSYKTERDVELQLNLMLLPVSQQDLEIVKSLVISVKQKAPQVISMLTPNEQGTVQQLFSTERVNINEQEVQFRRVITQGKRKKVIQS